jgi:hypothetical protein
VHADPPVALEGGLSEEWIECKNVFFAVKAEYDNRDYSGENWAPSTIIDRLKTGAMIARAAHFHASNDLTKMIDSKIIDNSLQIMDTELYLISKVFWSFINIGKAGSSEDWISGDFTLDIWSEEDFTYISGSAQGVEFLNKNLPAIGKLNTSQAKPIRDTSNRGRPTAAWCDLTP